MNNYFIFFMMLFANSFKTQTIPDQLPNQTINGKKEGNWVFWYNKKWKPTTIKDSIAFYRKITFKNDKPTGLVNDFYKSGKMQWEGKLLSIEPDVIEGKAIWYYENGNKSSEINFVNGLKEGEEIDFYENGEIKSNFKYYSGYVYEKTIVSQLSENIKILKYYNSFANKPIKIQKFINNELILEIDNKDGDFSSCTIKKKSNDDTLISTYLFGKKIGKIKILKKDTIIVFNKSFLSEFTKIKLDRIENCNLKLKYLSDSLNAIKSEINLVSKKDLEKKRILKRTYTILDNYLFCYFKDIPLMKNFGNIFLFPFIFPEALDNENLKTYSNYYKYYISNFPKWIYNNLDITNFENLSDVLFFKEFLENYSNLKKYNFDDTTIYNLYNAFKGIGLYSKVIIKNTLNEIPNKNIKHKYNELIALYEKRNKLDAQNESFIDDFFEADEKIDNLNEELEKFSLEEKLIFKAPSLEQIQNAILPQEVFVDYYDIQGTYYAVVITNQSNPIWVKLDINQEFINSIKSSNTSQNINQLYSSANPLLYQKLVQPIAAYLQGKKRLSVSPDGILHNIAWQAIMQPNGKPLSEDYQLRELSSSRSLYIKEREIANTQTDLFASVQYNSSEYNSQVVANKELVFDKIIEEYKSKQTKSGAEMQAFDELDPDQKETEDVSKILDIPQEHLFVKDRASEENFRKLDKQSSEIIFISTHGFYFPMPESKGENKSTKKPVVEIEGIGRVKSYYNPMEDPMFRSGLAMYGANETWLGRKQLPAENDGLLLAKEVSALDLSNTKLVVLSACQTAKGDITSGEGVFGLQRAFKQAGVEYIVASLWDVPNIATREMMTAFFKYLKTDKNPVMAIEKARNEMKQLGKTPYQYQGFVVIR